MTPTLQDRVHRVACQARRLVRLYGIGWFVACVCLATMVVGMIDYLVRFEDVGIRLICFLLLGGTVVWSFTRFIIVAWRYRCSELQAARHIEHCYPGLRDQLTSAVAFAADSAEGDEAGSIELRHAVIAETEAATGEIDFDRCFNRRQPARALGAALISVAAIAVLTLLDGPSVSLAARRLLVPWGHHPWPRRHALQWVEAPTRLAVGQDFEVRLADTNGPLPERVEIHYWFKGDAASEVQTFPMQPLGDHMVHRLAGITRPFRYRATGGDDQKMPWIALTLVEPPRITTREIELHPPAYTGLDARRVDGSFRALIGTRLSVRVRTSKPLSAALLDTDTMEGDATIKLTLDGDRYGFFLEEAKTDWTIVRSGSYGFRLITQDGLDVGVPTQWDVHAVRDLPPTISLRHPATDLRITSAAQLSIEAIVKDDLAVRTVELQYVRSTSADQGEERVILWAGPDRVVSEAARGANEGDQGVQRTVKYVWDLTRIPSMKPGEWIDFRVTAVDYKLQAGESVTRRLTFISGEELQERIAQRQSELLTEIAEVVRLQRDTYAQVADLGIQVREAGKLQQEDADQLQVAELNQRQVRQRLGHPSDGVAAQVLALIGEARSNRMENSDLLTRLWQFHDTIQRLNDDPLAAIQHPLVDAVKIVRESPIDSQGTQRRQIDGSAKRELIGLLERVGTGQRQVIETLAKLLGEMEQWDNYQRLAREVGRLKRDQENVNGRTQQLRVETLAVEPNDLDAQQRASVKRLAQRQNGIALRFGILASGMETARQKLIGDDPTAAATLADALAMVRQDGISGRMRDIGREMEQNRLGQAVDQQETVIKLLAELQDILANRREYQLDRKVEQLRDATAQLERMANRQQTLQKETENAAAVTPQQFGKWEQEEADLARQVQKLTRQVQRQGADAASAALTTAGQCLGGACQAAGAKDLDKTRQKSKDALNSLDKARRQVKAALEDARDSLRDQWIGRLRQTVREFLSRQQRLIDETRTAEVERQANPDFQTTQWQQVVQTLAIDQIALSQEVGDVGARLADVVIFAFALQRTALRMASAGHRLESGNTGRQADEQQRLATEHLQQILSAMEAEPSPEQQDKRQAKPPTDPADKKPTRAAKYMLAQLKLIRALQRQVNRETELLDQMEGPWNAQQVTRQQDLVRQQRRLAEIVVQLLESSAEAPKPTIVRPPVEKLDSLDRALELDQEGK